MKKITLTCGPNTFIRRYDDFDRHTGVIYCEGDHLEVSDGYHTLDEVYEHRISLYIALCKRMRDDLEVCLDGVGKDHKVWRSRVHSDNTMFDNQFILGIGKHPGEQITYHIPMSRWDETDFAYTYEFAEQVPKWDAHTPGDVIERLKLL
jgi:hypothetical protein